MVLDRVTVTGLIAVIGALALTLLLGFTLSGQQTPGGSGFPADVGSATPTSETAKTDLGGTQPAIPRLSIHTQPARQEGTLRISASGFSPRETLTVLAMEGGTGPARDIGSARAGADGGMAHIDIELPEWLRSGGHTLQVKGESGKVASETLYVRAKEGWIELRDYAVRQAGRIGLAAGGFEPHDEIDVFLVPGQDRPAELGEAPLASLVADAAGNTEWTEIQLPMVNTGVYALIVRGKGGDVEVLRVIEVQPLLVLLELSPWSGPPGSMVTVNGQGFKPGETVVVRFEGQEQPAGTFVADRFGNVWDAGPVQVPLRAAGSEVGVTLEGVDSGARVAQRFSVIAGHAWGELSSYAGPPGASVFFAGGGFGSEETVTIRHGDRGGTELFAGRTTPDGRFSRVGPVVIPADAGEEMTFTLVGEDSGAEATVRYTVLRPLGPRE